MPPLEPGGYLVGPAAQIEGVGTDALGSLRRQRDDTPYYLGPRRTKVRARDGVVEGDLLSLLFKSVETLGFDLGQVGSEPLLAVRVPDAAPAQANNTETAV